MTQEEKQTIITRLETCPFNREQGFKVTQLEEGRAVLEVEIQAKHKNIWNLPHGGILFALADVASGLATHSLHKGLIVTASSNVNFLFASPQASLLRAEGSVIKKGHSLVVVQAEIYDQDDNHLLTGQFNMYIG